MHMHTDPLPPDHTHTRFSLSQIKMVLSAYDAT
jgi:hypothetical protein